MASTPYTIATSMIKNFHYFYPCNNHMELKCVCMCAHVHVCVVSLHMCISLASNKYDKVHNYHIQDMHCYDNNIATTTLEYSLTVAQ